ncbi:MAG: sugar ABC transporter ATP-binding protein [Lachnospiraceae bacterium]|nr:sugar ABC transporter ATP-binding protein [Lachnospiraceae bacterium]
MADTLLELKGISKAFGSNQVLTDVNFTLNRGEVHSVIGENGAGKSTMMNIIYGLLTADSGEIYVEGSKVEIKGSQDAQRLGIGFVHQEIALCPEMTVAQNIFMSQINRMNALNLDYKKLNQQAQELLDSIIEGIDAGSPVEFLSISNQQVVEIARALSEQCKVLILDEPTASLSESETEALFAIMRRLKERGIGIIYISHRLSEIFEQCDRVTVLRDGEMINTYRVKEVEAGQLVNDMAGREIDSLYPPKAEEAAGKIVLKVEELADQEGRFRNVAFELHAGEILGFSGLVGSGRTEIMEAVVGLRRKKSGRILFEGTEISGKKTEEIYDSGLVYMSEDRKNLGLFLEMDIEKNVASMHRKVFGKKGMPFLIDSAKEDDEAKHAIALLGVKCMGKTHRVGALSGGNQQKVMISKLFTKEPKVVIVDEPTRGVDVGAKSEIHNYLRWLAGEGMAIIMISSELNEIIGMCDRVLVMHEGEICAQAAGEDINSNYIMHYASGAYLLSEQE